MAFKTGPFDFWITFHHLKAGRVWVFWSSLYFTGPVSQPVLVQSLKQVSNLSCSFCRVLPTLWLTVVFLKSVFNLWPDASAQLWPRMWHSTLRQEPCSVYSLKGKKPTKSLFFSAKSSRHSSVASMAGPEFKSRQGRELLILNEKDLLIQIWRTCYV